MGRQYPGKHAPPSHPLCTSSNKNKNKKTKQRSGKVGLYLCQISENFPVMFDILTEQKLSL